MTVTIIFRRESSEIFVKLSWLTFSHGGTVNSFSSLLWIHVMINHLHCENFVLIVVVVLVVVNVFVEQPLKFHFTFFSSFPYVKRTTNFRNTVKNVPCVKWKRLRKKKCSSIYTLRHMLEGWNKESQSSAKSYHIVHLSLLYISSSQQVLTISIII